MTSLVQAQTRGEPTCPWGEHEVLRERVDAYFERMRDGHVAVGRVPGVDAIELWNNDYLSLGGHPTIVRAQTAALESGSGDLYMSAVFLNDTSLQRAFERQMAAFVHAEAAVLCQSGWCANAGIIQALADSRTPVYLDQFATTSLWEGARAAGAPIHPFRHNRPESLERLIKRNGVGLVAVDAVYAIDGSVCPFAEIVELAEQTRCIVVADESHSIGIHGPHGEGLVPSLGLTDKVHYRTFSLSKAFVTRAGMVVGPERTMSYFPYESRPAIFSSAVLPYEISALVATLNVIQEEDWRRQQLWYNTHYLRTALARLGYSLGEGDSQVIALDTGSERETVAFRDALEAEGIFAAVLCAPATRKGRGIIRVSVNAGLSEADLDRVIAAFKKVRDAHALRPERLFERGEALDLADGATASVASLKRAAAGMRAALARWSGGAGPR